jgi:hypothetical protein
MVEEEFILDLNLAFKFVSPCVIARSELVHSTGINFTAVRWLSYLDDDVEQFGQVLERHIVEFGIDVVYFLAGEHTKLLHNLKAG